MSDCLYLTSTGRFAGKASIALGVMELLSQHVRSIGVFRPLITAAEPRDALLDLLLTRYHLDQEYSSAYAATYADLPGLLDGTDPSRLVSDVLDRVAALRREHDFVVVIGSDFNGPTPALEPGLNAALAANLSAPVIDVVSGLGLDDDDVAAAVAASRALLGDHGCAHVATIVNRADPDRVDALRLSMGAAEPPVYVVPDLPVLSALTVAEVRATLHATMLSGDESATAREVDEYVVGTGHLPLVLSRLHDGALLVTSSDRTDLALTAAAAAASDALPTPAGVVLTFGTPVDDTVKQLLAPSPLPVLSVSTDAYATMRQLEGLRGELRPGSTRKIAAALGAFADSVDPAALSERIRLTSSDVVTPLMFSSALLARARETRQRIVLPESDDVRVLRAAEVLTHRGVANLILLGDPEQVTARAARLGLSLAGVEIVDPAGDPRRVELATTYARLRAHKGVTPDLAYDVAADPTYFGTLLVAAGYADGMVCGAAHTTAATVRPALEVIRTAEGFSLVSSAFLMCLPDKVLVFADCAVNPDPTAEQLADIAVCTADTAIAFGIEPRVALISYSTGSSGTGADVDKVRRAAELVATRRPELPLAGPIQYDAAVDPDVGAAKLPGNPVAGNATVFIFPDLNSGNATYKAVQRAAHAVAVGPVLQGLRKPVNDLSRGCTIPDIVNTVAITAIQAQVQGARPDSAAVQPAMQVTGGVQ